MLRVRFAPSPTGFVHVGNARTALFNFLHAGKTNGATVLRIEDTDVERSKKEYEKNLIADLKWLGIEWDEGPDVGGEYGPYRQSERNEMYQTYARRLIDENKAYYCFCSSEDLEKEKRESVKLDDPASFIHKCRKLDMEESKKRVAGGEDAATRFKVPKNKKVSFKDLVRGEVSFDTNLLNDPVILRSSGIPAYNFSVVIDDFSMKINLVIRGEDHLSNTARQVLIYEALNQESPHFAHLSMVMGEDNTKLSKRHGSTSIAQFREQGYLPAALLNYLSLLGWSPGENKQVLTKKELIEEFNLEKVSKSAAIFDYRKLQWLNREHMRLLPDKNLGETLSPFLKKEGFSFEETSEILTWIGKTAKVLSNYHHLLTGIAEAFKDFTTIDVSREIMDSIKNSETSPKVISTLYEEVGQLDSPVAFAKVAEITKKIRQETGIKGKGLYHPIRLALTGKESGIELSDFIPIIEEGSTINITPRIKNMKARLEPAAAGGNEL
jgi:nondiscriminating glutamyl-tRNA synthetase